MSAPLTLPPAAPFTGVTGWTHAPAPAGAYGEGSGAVPKPRRRRRGQAALRWIASLAFLGFVAVATIWHLQGGRWVRVETASMGTVAPVGSLLWVKPVDFDTLVPGDFITFTPPGRQMTFSHLVDVRHADGTIGTKGVLSRADSWRLGPDDVVGRVAMTWQGAGWVALMAPYLFGGLLLIALIRRLLPVYARGAVALVLTSLLLAGLLSYYQPLVSAQQMAFQQIGDSSARVTFVGTGLLPVEVIPQDGSGGVILRNGETDSVLLRGLRTDEETGQVRHLVGADLKGVVPWWLWVGLIVLAFSPALLDARRHPLSRGNRITA